MTITWFGQSCFRIEAKEGSILIDPFSKEIGLRPPKIKDDLVLVTHQHMDHNNTTEMNPEALLIDGPGEYERKGIQVQGILSYHDKSQGKERGLNTIYLIKAEEMTLCHLGDFGQGKLDDSQVEAIGDVDLLLVPVGGTYTIDAKEAVEVISQVEPKVIIPMHYKIPDLAVDLDAPEKFIKEVGLTPEKVDKYRISKKLLPVEETKLIMLQ
ncbi:MAG: MBL fold metallo-hydrolase [Candidatus Yanofskybacteria bacterium]|nr:MBL fold metallo-hydrolase [Candidatus Yanofskybacteria bacterium]